MATKTAPYAGTAGSRSRVFTEYVASLGGSGDPPDRASFDRVWRALRLALRTELRRRGLWTSPPRYLGVVGADAWNEEVLDELAEDAYVFNFVDRLRSLKAQLEVKPNVDGLVRLNLKNFLYERQRRYDPLGCRLFGTLRRALTELTEAGDLEVVEGDPGIRNDTVLRFSDALPAEAAERTESYAEPAIHELVTSWSDELLPDLVTARGRRLEAVAAELSRRIRELQERGFGELTVKALADPLKAAVRERWRARHVGDDTEVSGSEATESDVLFAETRRKYRPDAALEDAEAFEKLTACIERQLHGLDKDERFEEYLNVLWQYLRLHAVGERDLPSRRKLAELLGIPRNRFPELYETLGVLLEQCRRLLFEPLADREGGMR